jgi:hypothetical protein
MLVQPYSGVSDVPRHTTVSDVPEQNTSLTDDGHAEITPRAPA